MKEINAKKLVSAPVRRRQVEYAHQRGLSKRSACALMNVARSTLGYRPAACQGCAGDQRNAQAGSAVSAVRLPPHPRLPRAGGTSHGLGSRSPPVALGRAASAEETTAPSNCIRSSAPVAGHWRQPSPGLRLCLRWLCQRTAVEVSYRDRRMDARMLGDRRARQHPLQTRDRSFEPTGFAAWCACVSALRQRTKCNRRCVIRQQSVASSAGRASMSIVDPAQQLQRRFRVQRSPCLTMVNTRSDGVRRVDLHRTQNNIGIQRKVRTLSTGSFPPRRPH
jgi:hypothetical protein